MGRAHGVASRRGTTRPSSASRTRYLLSFVFVVVALFLSTAWIRTVFLLRSATLEARLVDSSQTLDKNMSWPVKESKSDTKDTPVSTTNVAREPPQNQTLDALAKTINKQATNQDCPFRNSPIYQSVYVYPSPGEEEWKGDILSESGKTNNIEYPWVAIDRYTRQQGTGPYDIEGQLVQYNTELLVREIIQNPKSCLRSYDPETATLFYVPYLPSAEFHNGTLHLGDYTTSKFGQALMTLVDTDDYRQWEEVFGLTSKYWKRRNGADHILVFSEPMHGLWHPRSKRGNFHFVHTQKQLTAPIVISVELSTTFVRMYPNCARKNILMPYPNTNGKWFNGKLNQEVATHLHKRGLDDLQSPATLPVEREIARQYPSSPYQNPGPRSLAQFFKAGMHGTCTKLRESLKADYLCTESGRLSKKHRLNYAQGYRHSTFCPCPGGDSPSAKRMFDALFAGCIPIVLSKDYVWPFSEEFDSVGGNDTTKWLDPVDFSIRLESQEFRESGLDEQCQVKENGETRIIQSFLERHNATEILRLRDGVQVAAERYSYYRSRPDLPDNPLREGVMPDGGAAHALVQALSERAGGALWPACERELKTAKVHGPSKFFC